MAPKAPKEKQWKAVTREFAKIVGFWNIDDGPAIGKVVGHVTSGEYPFFVLECTEDTACQDSEQGILTAHPGDHFGVSGSKVLEVLGKMVGSEVRLSYTGREKNKAGTREFKNFKIETSGEVPPF